ncbi:hypothetical protein GUJ93_ZPchr0010g10531 [Zizania palustris]|uniref:Uncharacterized protein n=1 Tax=Zizania palustris TaxID=103762 RepID=A0A8J6BH48_ZIZPA|nr:hypothetical protein GUJ93_ZPchr0010g10531 [Zizania palustris]
MAAVPATHLSTSISALRHHLPGVVAVPAARLSPYIYAVPSAIVLLPRASPTPSRGALRHRPPSAAAVPSTYKIWRSIQTKLVICSVVFHGARG